MQGFMRILMLLIIMAFAGLLAPSPAAADTLTQARLNAWLQTTLWPDAAAAGVTRPVFDQLFAGVTPNPAILRHWRSQPESTRTAADYIDLVVTAARVDEGRRYAARDESLIAQIEAAFGVDRHIILAIWAVETSYGRNKGNYSVLSALATLGASGQRDSFARRELLALLKLAQAGKINAAQLTGSWSGAMGHTQFIPSSYAAYAVDFDGDDHADIWTSIADALASTGNYLAKAGHWQRGQKWGFTATLSPEFRRAGIEPGITLTLDEWRRRGVKANHQHAGSMRARLLLPAGFEGPAFLVGANFDAVLRYNPATLYALAVVLLADQISGQPVKSPFAEYPETAPLRSAERRELQQRLNKAGFNSGVVDGRVGTDTRRAIVAYQKAHALPIDGHPDHELLDHLAGRRPAIIRPPRQVIPRPPRLRALSERTSS